MNWAGCSPKLTPALVKAGTSLKSSTDPSSNAGGNGSPSLPTHLVWSGPSQISNGVCRPYVITAKDTNEVAAPVTANLLVSLSGVGLGSFFADASCATAGTSTTSLLATQSVTTIYYRPTASGVILNFSASDTFGSLSAGDYVVAVATSGTLDTSFNGTGKRNDALPGSPSEGRVALLDSGGRLLVVGASSGATPNGFIVRYTAAGALDSTFGSNGVVSSDLQVVGGAKFYGGALQSDGKIVVTGWCAGGGVPIARFNADGSPDTSFSNHFYNFDGDIGRVILVQADGKLVVAGTTGLGEMFALRTLSDGTLDTSFNGSGVQNIGWGGGHLSHVYAAALDANQKIILAGDVEVSPGYPIFAIVRLNTSGIPDITFNTSGKQEFSISSGPSTINALAIQPDGKIVLTGNTNSGISEVALARLNSDGLLDATFGTGGKVVTYAGQGAGGASAANSVRVQSDGRIIVGGYSQGGMGGNDFAVLRYGVTGNLDPTYNLTGIRFIDLGGNDTVFAGALDAASNFIMVGTDGSSLAIAKTLP